MNFLDKYIFNVPFKTHENGSSTLSKDFLPDNTEVMEMTKKHYHKRFCAF